MPIPPTLAALLPLAEAAAHQAYAPYSNFHVGAAILLEPLPGQESGQTITGCNVENASYRLTTCAEQNAITTAVTLHGPAIRIAAVAVHVLGHAACQPCGACRQTIAEFAGPTTPILYPGAHGPETCTLADLLPAAFHLSSHP